jgi:hypothetical protein
MGNIDDGLTKMRGDREVSGKLYVSEARRFGVVHRSQYQPFGLANNSMIRAKLDPISSRHNTWPLHVVCGATKP